MVGALALVAGLVFCFRGYVALRLVIPVWGAFAGFGVGAGAVAAVTGDGFLSSAVAWLVGLGVAVVFAALSYLFFEVAVTLTMASVGFALGSVAMVALGARWTWTVVAAGALVGLLLAVLAIASDLPLLVLVVLSALAGSSVAVTGVMLLAGALETTDFTSSTVTSSVDGGWAWSLAYLVLAGAGLASQLGAARRERETLRRAWAGAERARPAAP